MEQNREISSHISENFTIFQREDCFKFGTDAVLLSRFAKIRKKDVLFDICSGTGAVGFFCQLLYDPKEIHFVEIDPVMTKLSQKTASYNDIEEKCRFYCTDIRDLSVSDGVMADVITVNPPYFLEKSGKLSQNENLKTARHTQQFSHSVLFLKAYRILRDGGRIFLIQRAQNLAEILSGLREHRLEPKRLRMVYGNPKKDANLFLVEAVKNGGVWMDCLPPLNLYDENGEMTEEFRLMQEF
ncbi:MAG: methyltransferase [Clostridia bacterium]|nr:methyltransferase [Clostridia bacterium]